MNQYWDILCPIPILRLQFSKHIAMQVYVDKYQFLQLGKSGYKFSKKLEPTSPFYSYFREAIMETYQTDLGLGVDDLGIKLHLFRSWIDKQSMDYIRTNYKGPRLRRTSMWITLVPQSARRLACGSQDRKSVV